MAKPLRPKRGTTAKNDAFTGLASEITVDTEKHSIRVHDGVTAGGHALATDADLATVRATADAAQTTADAAQTTADAAQTTADAAQTTAEGALPKSGGVLVGEILQSGGNPTISQSVDDDKLLFNGGTAYGSGASLSLSGKDRSGTEGLFNLVASNGTSTRTFSGKPDGTLTWAGKEVERVNATNSKYIRYENGVQIIWGGVTVPENVTTTTLTFPVAFSGTNYCVCLTHMSTAAQLTWAAATKTTTTVQVTRKQSSSGSVAFSSSADYVAIGRWK